MAQPFISLPKSEWNDVLNNYRIPLGVYDFKRMLFAKNFLYSTDEFSQMYKFTIVRNPYDRAVSIWKYITRYHYSLNTLTQYHRLKMKSSFDYFLASIPEIWETKKDRHIFTHTAPIWSDITDEEGNLLLDEIFRLEELEKATEKISKKLNLKITQFDKVNRNRLNKDYKPFYNKQTRKRVEELYEQDISNLNYNF